MQYFVRTVVLRVLVAGIQNVIRKEGRVVTLSDFLNLFSDDECGFVIINNVNDNHNMILSKHQVIMMHEDKLNNVIKRVYPYAWNWEVIFEINV